ncbi:hypothetical protein C0991_004864, partial [Blastosporella zonata]
MSKDRASKYQRNFEVLCSAKPFLTLLFVPFKVLNLCGTSASDLEHLRLQVVNLAYDVVTQIKERYAERTASNLDKI